MPSEISRPASVTPLNCPGGLADLIELGFLGAFFDELFAFASSLAILVFAR